MSSCTEGECFRAVFFNLSNLRLLESISQHAISMHMHSVNNEHTSSMLAGGLWLLMSTVFRFLKLIYSHYIELENATSLGKGSHVLFERHADF